MRQNFYFWLFFGTTVAVIVAVWAVVFSKTIRYSLAGDGKTKMQTVSDGFKEIELKLKSFQSINRGLFNAKSEELKEKALQEAALKRMKERLEDVNWVRTTN